MEVHMQRFELSNLVPGQERVGAVCVRSRQERETRGGKPYLVLELANLTGATTARIWSERLTDWEGITPGDGVDIRARVQPGWNGGQPELEVLEMSRLPDYDPIRLELNPRVTESRDALEERFDRLVQSIERPEARCLVARVTHSVGRDRYFTSPAAKMHHHNAIGGLALHSIEVAELALAMAGVEPFIGLVDRDALVVGSLLHDIGKTIEMDWEGVPIDYSRAGQLRSHICRGVEIVTLAVQWALEAGSVSRLDVEHLKHVIHSHHGQAEWGAPTPPRTVEATIIHHGDLVSARLRPLADRLMSAPADAQHWIDPTDWKQKPLWAFARARAEEADAFGSDPPPVEPPPWDAPAPWEGETAVHIIPANGGPDA